MVHTFHERGWCRFAFDPTLRAWVDHVLPAARKAVAALENAIWRRCGGTWFAGVNVLPNDASGSVDGGPPLAGAAVDFIQRELSIPAIAWDRGQVSVCYPGYPHPMASESEAQFRFRRDRDAAHVDGLLPVGPQRRRHLREHHAFVLGIPLTETVGSASPLVVWEGSHEIIRQDFREALRRVPPERWGEVDLTATYHAVRQRIFETCMRVEIIARPGEAYLVHRLALHGVAPWGENARAGPDGRMIVYFRPGIGAIHGWLEAL